MYYIGIDGADSNKLVYYCRNCGDINKNITSVNMNVSVIQLKQSTQEFSNFINPYTKLDPTLPRYTHILCPNSECLTNTKEANREIICVRYDDVHIKYLYLCSTCDVVWKTNDL